MKPTIVHRDVGDYVHILNYTTGDIMSFEAEEGHYLLDNWDNPRAAGGKELAAFIASSGSQVNSRRFRASLVDLGMEFSFPTIAHLELNRRCSLSCRHCYIGQAELKSREGSFFDRLSIEDIQRLLDSLAGLGVFLLVLTGGEPFLNVKAEAVLSQAAAKGFVVEVFSNLQYLPPWFKALDRLGSRVGRIQTSVYAAQREAHDAITGLAGSLERTLANLRFLRERGFYVEAATPLMVANFDYRQQTERHFRKLRVPQAFSWPILNEYYSEKRSKASLNVSKQQFARFWRERPGFLIKTDFSSPDSPICAAARALLSVSAEGDVFPCSQYPVRVGSLTVSGIETAVRSVRMEEIAAYKCRDAGTVEYPYNFCMGNNYSENRNPFVQPLFVRETLEHCERILRRG